MLKTQIEINHFPVGLFFLIKDQNRNVHTQYPFYPFLKAI